MTLSIKILGCYIRHAPRSANARGGGHRSLGRWRPGEAGALATCLYLLQVGCSVHLSEKAVSLRSFSSGIRLVQGTGASEHRRGDGAPAASRCRVLDAEDLAGVQVDVGEEERPSRNGDREVIHRRLERLPAR